MIREFFGFEMLEALGIVWVPTFGSIRSSPPPEIPSTPLGIENIPQISAKPIAFQRNLLGKLPQNWPFFTNRFSMKLASKIPAEFQRNRPFFREFVPENLRNLTFLGDLPEALTMTSETNSACKITTDS